jgi:hypothetical protein
VPPLRHFLDLTLQLPRYLVLFRDRNLKWQLLLVLRAGDGLDLLEGLLEVVFEELSVLGTTMDQDDMGGFDFLDELCGLLAVRVGGETDLGHVQVDGYGAVALHALDQVPLLQIVRYRPLRAVPCDNNPIPWIMAPPFQQRSRLSTLQHTRGTHDHHRTAFFLQYSLIGLQIVYVPVLEGVVDLLVETLLDLLAQHVDVGFVDVLAFLD